MPEETPVIARESKKRQRQSLRIEQIHVDRFRGIQTETAHFCRDRKETSAGKRGHSGKNIVPSRRSCASSCNDRRAHRERCSYANPRTLPCPGRRRPKREQEDATPFGRAARGRGESRRDAARGRGESSRTRPRGHGKISGTRQGREPVLGDAKRTRGDEKGREKDTAKGPSPMHDHTFFPEFASGFGLF